MYSALKNKVHPMKPEIKDELLDELLKNYTSPEDLMGPEGLLAELKQRLISRVLDSELTTHLGYEKHSKRQLRRKTLVMAIPPRPYAVTMGNSQSKFPEIVMATLIPNWSRSINVILMALMTRLSAFIQEGSVLESYRSI